MSGYKPLYQIKWIILKEWNLSAPRPQRAGLKTENGKKTWVY